jgi:hypothetical protein
MTHLFRQLYVPRLFRPPAGVTADFFSRAASNSSRIPSMDENVVSSRIPFMTASPLTRPDRRSESSPWAP